MAEDISQRTITLGATDGFRYLGIQPPLSLGELDNLPMPRSGHLAFFSDTYISIEHFEEDNSMDIGFEAIGQDEYIDEAFARYGIELAHYLGNVELHTNVVPIGSSSTTSQILHDSLPKY